MAITHQYTILCDYATQDSSGKGFLIGTFSDVWFPYVPAVLRLNVVVGFTGDPNAPVWIIICDPHGRVIENIEFEPDSFTTAGTSRLYEQQMIVAEFTTESLELPEFGVYSVILREGNDVIHTAHLGVMQTDPEG